MKSLLILWCVLFAIFAGAIDSIENCPAKYVNALCAAKDHSLWVAGEDSGVFQWQSGKWTAYLSGIAGFPATKNFTAVCSDLQGRIWVGTMDRGIAVYNGAVWQSYDVRTGPLSARIYDIRCSAQSGLVAIAHANGVTLWYPDLDKWQDITALDGLPHSPVRSVCFTEDDSLYLAMECGGVALVSSASRYRKCRVFQTKWLQDRQRNSRYPLKSSGKGLPCNWCNVVLCAADMTVYCGTVGGLGIARTLGDFTFLRGADYWEKIQGLYAGGEKVSPKNDAKKDLLLPEDYITAIGEFAGQIFCGFRSRGVCGIGNQDQPKVTRLLSDLWVTSFGVVNGNFYAGTYGHGIKLIAKGKTAGPQQLPTADQTTQSGSIPPLPASAASGALSVREILAKSVFTAPGDQPKLNQPWCRYVKDDWETRGNWCERHGYAFGILCAANAPISNLRYRFFPQYNGLYEVKGAIGLHAAANDALRNWGHWVRADDNNHDVLWAPCTGTRIEAEWGDHGEAYPRANDGPDLWIKTRVPAGPHFISLYFFNPNGRNGVNGERDYLLEAYYFQTKDFNAGLEIEKLLKTEPLARARVALFTSGVHKVFAVNGPGNYAFRIIRNHSFNTILNGVFIAPVMIPDQTYTERAQMTFDYHGAFPPKPAFAAIDITRLDDEVKLLWAKSFEPRFLPFQQIIQASLLRTVTEPEFAAVMRWLIPVWNDRERDSFVAIMRQNWENHQQNSVLARSGKQFPNSPGVVDLSIDELEQMEHCGIDWQIYRNATKVQIEILRKQLRRMPSQTK